MPNLCDRIINRAIKLKPVSSDIKKFSINKDGRIRLQIDGDVFFKSDNSLRDLLCKSQDLSNVPLSCIDAMGLMLVKKFFPFFIEYLSKMGEDEYNNRLVTSPHVHFTAQMCGGNMEITFHVSILHDMMLENLNVY